MKKRWVLRTLEKPAVVAELQQALNDLPEALARALVLRGIETFEQARQFFRPSLSDLHDPFLMRDMDAAADRVATALRGGERILVYGDYDVDGTTSTALMTHFLRSMGAPAAYFIPNRFRDGYGLGPTGIDEAARQGASLIVALDCGITAVEEARYARERGLDLVICDHHTAGHDLPDAVAVLDPKRPDCAYPFKELCGCGVTFKLVQAVLHRLGEPPERALPYLDLVAVATASDIVPIVGENRVLMREGLALLQQNPRLGLRALADVAGIELATLTTRGIVFGLGPRINAAGRLGDAGGAVDLMLAESDPEAAALAHQLEQVNELRRNIDQETVEQAAKIAEQQLTARTRHTLVLHHPTWHLGVVGIVASRLVERFYRPTIMLATAGDRIKGSARSINGINIYQALQGCADLLSEFGGHDHAAGLTLPEANLQAFRERFEAVVREVVTPDMLDPVVEVDAPLDLHAIDGRFWAVLKQFEPFGPSNLTPVFHARHLTVAGSPRAVGRDGGHIKFTVRQQTAAGAVVLPVIGFNMQEHLPTLLECRHNKASFEMLFSVDENTWKGKTTLQLQARELRLEKTAPVRLVET